MMMMTHERVRAILEEAGVLMPHEAAVRARCTLEEAQQALMYLEEEGEADGYILVYHRTHNEDPLAAVDARPFSEGRPELPYVCPDCDEEVSEERELEYDLMFKRRRETA